MKKERLYLKNLEIEDWGNGYLSEVTLLLREGECISMVSTANQKEILVHYLQGRGKKLSGMVRVCGREVRQGGKKEMERNRVFVVGKETPYMDSLSAADNIFLLRHNSLKKILINEKAMKSQAEYYFEKYGILMDPGRKNGEVSMGEKILVGLIRCVSQGARVIVLHDVSGAFAGGEIQRILKVIRLLKEEGVGILVSDNHPEYFYEVSDRLVVFKHKRIVKKIYDPEAFFQAERIIQHGSELSSNLKKIMPKKGNMVKIKTALWEDEYEFHAGKGEIVLIDIPSTRMEQLWQNLCCCGKNLPEYFLEGRKLTYKTIDGLVRQGVVFGREKRKETVLAQNLSAEENIFLPSMKKIGTWLGFYRKNMEYILKDDFLLDRKDSSQSLNLDRDRLKIEYYRWKLYRPKVMLLYNVFTEADFKERDWLRNMMISMAARGTAVLLLENEKEYCQSFADRAERGQS